MTTILEYGRLCNAIYAHPPEVQGWTLAQFRDSLGSGLQAGLFTRGQTKVVAFKGTTLSNVNDLIADLKLGTGMNTTYFSNAETFVERYAPGDDVIFTGHSLGGAIAQVVGNRRRLPFVTFNAPGVAIVASQNLHTATAHMSAVRAVGGLVSAFRHPMQMMQDVSSAFHISRGVNYRLDFDPVSAIGLHYGPVVTLQSNVDLTDRHFMDSVITSLERFGYGNIEFPG